MNKELDYLRWLVDKINYHYPKTVKFKLQQVIQEIERYVISETDLRFEAATMSDFREANQDNECIYIPRVLWQYVSQNVMVMEWVEAIKITDRHKIIDNDLNISDIVSNLAKVFFDQVYMNGYFHGDLHPGNIMVDKQNRIILLDFGVTGRLSNVDRMTIAGVIEGFIRKDYLKVAKLHVKAGYVPRNTDIYLFAQACRSIGEPIFG